MEACLQKSANPHEWLERMEKIVVKTDVEQTWIIIQLLLCLQAFKIKGKRGREEK